MVKEEQAPPSLSNGLQGPKDLGKTKAASDSWQFSSHAFLNFSEHATFQPFSRAKMTRVVDDKSQWCIPFVLERLDIHRQRYADVENPPPFFLGLSGVQGAGKTTLVRSGVRLQFIGF